MEASGSKYSAARGVVDGGADVADRHAKLQCDGGASQDGTMRGSARARASGGVSHGEVDVIGDSAASHDGALRGEGNGGAEAATRHEGDGFTRAVHEDAAHGAGDGGPDAVTRLAGAAGSMVYGDTETAEFLVYVRSGDGALQSDTMRTT